VIPVLVDGAPMPKTGDLPESLRGLARRQNIEISHTRFETDIERLTRTLVSILELVRPRETEKVREAEPRRGSQETEETRRYRLAADRGDADRQVNLGVLYELGRGGLPKDEREAARLYKLAADQGNAWGQTNLGLLYQNGRGDLRKDEREAARLFKLAADQGNAYGQAYLGDFYRDGRGVPNDELEAARLYKLATDQGNAAGQTTLGIFYESGRGGLPKDEREGRVSTSWPPTKGTRGDRPISGSSSKMAVASCRRTTARLHDCTASPPTKETTWRKKP
jgi:hypothetical protein